MPAPRASRVPNPCLPNPKPAQPNPEGPAVQPIHRASCQDTPAPSAGRLAGYLAELINTRARPRGASAEAGIGLDASGAPEGNELIWVEDDPGLAPRLVTEPSCGIIVVAHGPSQPAAQRSFVISFPLDGDGLPWRIPAVTGALAALNWTVLAVERCRTASGEANIAVLASKARPGGEQRLWLAEPSTAAPDHPGSSISIHYGPAQPGSSQPGLVQPGPIQPNAARAVLAAPSAQRDGAARVMRDQVEHWMNDGGATRDLAG